METTFFEKALEVASRITNPVAAAVFTAVLAAILFVAALRARKPRLLWLLASGMILLGLVPLGASTFLASRAVYRIRVTVLGLDRQPDDSARITSIAGGETKKTSAGWEVDFPPQALPSNKEVEFVASDQAACLAGNSDVRLGSDLNPSIVISLQPRPEAEERGVVLSQTGQPIEDVDVSVLGYAETAKTDRLGNFRIPAHTCDGQMMTLRAQRGDSSSQVTAIAGQSAEMILRNQ